LEKLALKGPGFSRAVPGGELLRALQSAQKLSFVSGYRFSDTASPWKSIAPLGAGRPSPVTMRDYFRHPPPPLKMSPTLLHFPPALFRGVPMSLVVKLEDDLGERSEWVILNGVLPGAAEPNCVLLAGVDPFGKTVFNHLQMNAFLKEWERVKERVRDDSQKEAWERVKQMAEACQQDRDLYLRFVGN
jgi:hypothetical protein